MATCSTEKKLEEEEEEEVVLWQDGEPGVLWEECGWELVRQGWARERRGAGEGRERGKGGRRTGQKREEQLELK